MHETQRYCVYEGGKRLVLELSTVALDVPYGDHFSVECRFDVTQVQVGQWFAHRPSCTDCLMSLCQTRDSDVADACMTSTRFHVPLYLSCAA